MNTKLFSGKYIDVDNVIVDPTHRSKGIGSVLMKWIEKHAKDIDAKMIVLDAFVGSTQAHKFYFKETTLLKVFTLQKTSRDLIYSPINSAFRYLGMLVYLL